MRIEINVDVAGLAATLREEFLVVMIAGQGADASRVSDRTGDRAPLLASFAEFGP